VIGPSPGRSPDKKSPSSPPGDRIRPATGPKDAPPAALPKNEALPAQAWRAHGEGRLGHSDGWRGHGTSDAPADTPPAGASLRSAASQPAASQPPGGWRPHRDEASQAGKPVFIVPGDGRITITSDDPEAVRQMEELLRAFSPPRGIVARNYGVYPLQNAKASTVGPVLQGMFRRMPGANGRGYGSVVIVPDDRLNALVVYANRTDRTAIESLLKVLDSSEMPESLMSDRIQMLPVKNTNAARMQRMLQDLYGTHLAPISVEEKTNSLVVMAAPATFAEIKRVVELLDSSAGGHSARTIEILRLKSASAERVEQALNIILREHGQRRPSTYSRGRPRVGG
jgi:hypothetical protein